MTVRGQCAAYLCDDEEYVSGTAQVAMEAELVAATQQVGLLKEGYSKARDNLRAEQSVRSTCRFVLRAFVFVDFVQDRAEYSEINRCACTQRVKGIRIFVHSASTHLVGQCTFQSNRSFPASLVVPFATIARPSFPPAWFC